MDYGLQTSPGDTDIKAMGKGPLLQKCQHIHLHAGYSWLDPGLAGGRAGSSGDAGGHCLGPLEMLCLNEGQTCSPSVVLGPSVTGEQ